MDRKEYLSIRKQLNTSRVNNFKGASVICSALLFLMAGVFLSLYSVVSLLTIQDLSYLKIALLMLLWLVSQFLLAIGIFQSFLVVHEAGHQTLFESKFINNLSGHFSSLFCLIPFFAWSTIHHQHHCWTGWKDKDPTTEKALPREINKLEKFILDISWKYWIPIFCPVYVGDNFWNIKRLFRIIKPINERVKYIFSAALIILFWVTIFVLLPVTYVFAVYGFALFLVLSLAELLMLSQHSHIHQELSQGEDVRPFSFYEQEVFTRSISLPRFLSKFLFFGFDRHELHHMFPDVLGLSLIDVSFKTENDINWRRWLRLAKSIPGHKLVFLTREETGIWL